MQKTQIFIILMITSFLCASCEPQSNDYFIENRSNNEVLIEMADPPCLEIKPLPTPSPITSPDESEKPSNKSKSSPRVYVTTSEGTSSKAIDESLNGTCDQAGRLRILPQKSLTIQRGTLNSFYSELKSLEIKRPEGAIRFEGESIKEQLKSYRVDSYRFGLHGYVIVYK